MVRVVPEGCKCVGLSGLCIQTALSQPCQSLGSWIRGHRQQMFSGAQQPLVTLIKPENRNLESMDRLMDSRVPKFAALFTIK
jgi:hypothetical protein